MPFDLQIDYRAQQDIEKAINEYINKSTKVAHKFYDKIQSAYDSLEKSPFFQIRYADYRCLP